jgi:hypothetical protein
MAQRAPEAPETGPLSSPKLAFGVDVELLLRSPEEALLPVLQKLPGPWETAQVADLQVSQMSGAFSECAHARRPRAAPPDAPPLGQRPARRQAHAAASPLARAPCVGCSLGAASAAQPRHAAPSNPPPPHPLPPSQPGVPLWPGAPGR